MKHGCSGEVTAQRRPEQQPEPALRRSGERAPCAVGQGGAVALTQGRAPLGEALKGAECEKAFRP